MKVFMGSPVCRWLKSGCLFFCLGTELVIAQSGLLDTTFNPGIAATNGLVETVLPQPDGKILICGNFTQFAGTDRSYICRLNSDGTLDNTFRAGPGYWVRHMSLQPDGKIIIGGFFTTVEGQPRGLIARLSPTGALDTNFLSNPGAIGTLGVSITGNPDPFVFYTAVQPDGKILITGNFTNYNGVNIYGIARLNPDGSLDTSFSVGSGLNTWGRSIQVLTNFSNKILVTGWFDNYRNSSHNRMALINPDGTPDTSFHPTVFADKTAVYGAVLLPTGKYIAVGHSENALGLFLQDIVRLNADGSVDSSFSPSANDKVESVRLQADGKILIGGYFSQVNGTPRASMARLNSDGTLDTSFNPSADNYIWTVALQDDQNILISGGFYHIDGISRNGVARLLPAAALQGPQLGNPQVQGTAFSVMLQSISGRSYTLQYKTSLWLTNWNSLPPIAGDGSVKTLTDSNLNSETRFYRVMQN
jgi:uncharacterized delta-60 repeat protein